LFLLALQDQNARFYPFQRNIIPHLPISIKNVNSSQQLRTNGPTILPNSCLGHQSRM
jgi:hypothetical protein